MKRRAVIRGLVCLALAFAAGGVWAQKDIRDTKHNLSGAVKGGGGVSADEDRRKMEREVCVFCHTPSASDGDANAPGANLSQGQPPRWQSRVDAALAFSIFDDIGRGGAVGEGGLLGAAVGSVSVACLSCHDSTQALGVAIIGKDDHPFGVPYRGADEGRAELQDIRRQLALGSAPYRLGWRIDDSTEFRPARSATVNRRRVWWASSAGGTQRTKADLPLYPRAVRPDDKDAPMVPFVECTSCHDPHTTQPLFLRVVAGQGRGSLCLTCHVQ